MVKFYRIKDTEIRKVARTEADGSQEITALIGTVRELKDRNIISGDDLDYCLDRWLVLPAGSDDSLQCSITYATLAEAKASIPA